MDGYLQSSNLQPLQLSTVILGVDNSPQGLFSVLGQPTPLPTLFGTMESWWSIVKTSHQWAPIHYPT